MSDRLPLGPSRGFRNEPSGNRIHCLGDEMTDPSPNTKQKNSKELSR